MHNDSRTPDEIERDIERERAQLAANVDALQSVFSPEALLSGLSHGMREHGGELTEAVTRSVKQNPVAVALTGVGLAWLVFGRSHEPDAPKARHEPDAAPATRVKSAPPRVNEDVASRFAARDQGYQPFTTSRTRPVEAFTAPSWARHDLDDDDGDDLLDWAGDAWDSATDHAASAARSLRASADDLSAGAEEAAEDAGITARSAAEKAKRRAERMQARLARGTEDMTDAARERVIMARRKAISVADRAQGAVRQGVSKGKDGVQNFVQEQPMVAGALAMALGAAIAGALPRTKTEDDLLGEKRDDLFAEAERVFEQERARMERAARATMAEAKDVARETQAKAETALTPAAKQEAPTSHAPSQPTVATATPSKKNVKLGHSNG
ncbi:MAG: DUF3618 domain-containing protein [Pseudomonadota bacterium]